MRILVTGSDGMVGRAVTLHCSANGDHVVAHNRNSLDITDADAVKAALENDSPDVVINCAAWTDVDGCQRDPERAFEVNARGVENLATTSRDCKAGFITISTDFVFEGSKEGFYTQRDDPHPLSVYGDSKLEGERRAQIASARTTVVRTGWVFGHGGRNFLSTVIDRARRGEALTAIADAYGSPTYADDLAGRLRELAQLDLPGIYHVVNSGAGTSYEEFARTVTEIAGCADARIETISMDALNRPAPRPRNSRLRCLMSEHIGLPVMPDWRDALKVFAARVVERSSQATPVAR